MHDELLTTDEVAAYLGRTRRTVEDWRLKGIGPTFVRLTQRGVRYRRSDIEAFLRERSYTSTADAAVKTAERERAQAAAERRKSRSESNGRGTTRDSRARR